MQEFINLHSDPEIKKIYRYLQTSDHFYYMSTKWFSDGDVHKYFNPFGSPYEAYINFRNVLSDFMLFTGFTFDVRHEVERLTKINRRQDEIIRELKHLVGSANKPKNIKKSTEKTIATTPKKAITKQREEAKKTKETKSKTTKATKSKTTTNKDKTLKEK